MQMPAVGDAAKRRPVFRRMEHLGAHDLRQANGETDPVQIAVADLTLAQQVQITGAQLFPMRVETHAGRQFQKRVANKLQTVKTESAKGCRRAYRLQDQSRARTCAPSPVRHWSSIIRVQWVLHGDDPAQGLPQAGSRHITTDVGLGDDLHAQFIG